MIYRYGINYYVCIKPKPLKVLKIILVDAFLSFSDAVIAAYAGLEMFSAK